MAQQRPVALRDLKGVGPRLLERLERLGIVSVQDLLFHLPLRYQDRGTVHAIGSLRGGGERLVQGRVRGCRIQFGRRRSLLTTIEDGSGALVLRQFHFSRSQQQALARAAWLRCFGEVRRGPTGLEMVHPEYTVFPDEPPPPEDTGWTAIYPATEGLGQRQIRKLVEQALQRVDELAEELLPQAVLAANAFPTLADALRCLHSPPDSREADGALRPDHPARLRLAFEELLAHHLAAWRNRARRERQRARPVAVDGRLWRRLLNSLEFAPTAAQQRVIAEIREDLARTLPAHRLLQGDVGSGKTLVAAAACLDVIEGGHQAALMAPTEILADQHHRNFETWLGPLGIRVAVLLGRQGARERRRSAAEVASGEASLVVGTHALFQDEVGFDDLALVVVDEQHRFGVMQRYRLREKGRDGELLPHQLTMTATPIPRSLAMSLYAEMDVSSIDELPPGRTPVETLVLPDSRRDEVIERIATACADGGQAYWVCAVIDGSEVLEAQAATDTAALLAEALPGIRVGLVHGRMRNADKERVMQDFRSAGIDLLVATTVIEVGVDVPNAGLMVIENAERLGLSQLHQLRGRVGRGARRSYCVLMYRAPLGEIARQRLGTMKQTNDGFEVARKDLELRGPGELMGTRQTGMQRMVVADLVRDQALLPMVRQAAARMVRDDPAGAARIVERWIRKQTELANV